MATQRRRNPIFGGIMAAIMVGFGAWRLYSHYVENEKMEGYQIILAFAMIAYGIFIGYQVLTQNND